MPKIRAVQRISNYNIFESILQTTRDMHKTKEV